MSINNHGTGSADLIIRGGVVINGTGRPGREADIAIADGRIIGIGDLEGVRAADEIDACGLVVAPGFINILSWAGEGLLKDGAGLSDISQGITLEVMGEGQSFGPMTPELREQWRVAMDLPGPEALPWETLDGFLCHLVGQGVAPNVASFIGAGTVRAAVLGQANRRPDTTEMARMCALVEQAMREGAMGLSSALIYAPDSYADTAELSALAGVAARHGGLYISHLRSEADRLLEAFSEFETIIRTASCRGEIYHIKAVGQANFHLQKQLLARIEQLRAEGLRITADLYPYECGSTGLYGAIPATFQDAEDWVQRLREPDFRAKVRAAIATPDDSWENLYLHSGPANILLAHFQSPSLAPYVGKTLSEVAQARGTDPIDTLIDLVIENGSAGVRCVFGFADAGNVEELISVPWVCFCTDSEAVRVDGALGAQSIHPRAYGSFPRALRLARDKGLAPLEQIIHRMTGLPADTLRLTDRGLIRHGYWADLVVFDPATVTDHATYRAPHQYATGIRDVLVNGVPVRRDGLPTDARPGMVVRGPGAQ